MSKPNQLVSPSHDPQDGLTTTPTVPLPDESRPGKASDLIKRFQAQVDASNEAPLSVSSSFAAPGKPRLSATSQSLPPTIEPGRRQSSAIGLDEKPLPPPPATEAVSNGEMKGHEPDKEQQEEDKPLYFRSAGLNEKPGVPPEEQGRKNAKEAFPDMKDPSVSEVAEALAASKMEDPEHGVSAYEKGKEDKEEEPLAADSTSLPAPAEPDLPSRNRSPIPHPIVTQPSVDVPAPAVVPGSADLLSGETSPVTAEPDSTNAEAAEALSPRSPTTPTLLHHEGLSRPTSPRANDGALRVPPTRADDSPPPPDPIHSRPDSPSLSRRSPQSSRQASLSPTLSRSESIASTSPRLDRSSAASSRGVHTPTASSLAKARPRVASGASSPTQSRSSGLVAGASGSSSPSPSLGSGLGEERRSSLASPPTRAAPFMSPSSSHDSIRFFPRQAPAPGSSATMSRQRSNSVKSNTSAATTAAEAGGAGRPRPQPVPTTGTPRSRKAAAEAAATEGAQTTGSLHRLSSAVPVIETPPRSKTPSVGAAGRGTPSKKPWGAPSTPTKTAAGSPKTSPQATRAPASVGGSPASRGRGAPVPAAGRKMATRGRVGLAGARGGRGGAVATAAGVKKEGPREEGGNKEKEGEKHGAPAGDAATSVPADSPTTDEPIPASSSVPADIPVFAGFGSRPHGKIGIPGEVDEEGNFNAKGAEELEAAAARTGSSAAESEAEDGK
ncbi:hypothetical protein JCM11251_007824 [Rhodosporidiobolus azoricus]